MNTSHLQQKLPQYLKLWLVFAVVSLLFYGLSYGLAQQILRRDANNPQIQIAEDGAQALSSGEDQSTISFPNTVDMSKTLSEFIMIFDDSGKLIASSGNLSGQTPQPPKGMFDTARKAGQWRETWQPRKDVRLAGVMIHYTGKNSGFILVARNLREVEKNEAFVGAASGAAWLVTLILSFVLCWLFWAEPRVRHHHEEVKSEETKS